MRGAFRHNPGRRRTDMAGCGPFNRLPPAHLSAELVPYWHRIVRNLAPHVLTGSDYMSVEIMATLLMVYSLTAKRAYATELRAWFGMYGATPAERARLSLMPAGATRVRLGSGL